MPPRGAGATAAQLDALPCVHPNAAGLDIGADTIYACVPSDRDTCPVRVFATFTTDLHTLADWLAACGIDTVAMESTGIYWLAMCGDTMNGPPRSGPYSSRRITTRLEDGVRIIVNPHAENSASVPTCVSLLRFTPENGNPSMAAAPLVAASVTAALSSARLTPVPRRSSRTKKHGTNHTSCMSCGSSLLYVGVFSART